MNSKIIYNNLKPIKNQLKKVSWLAYLHRAINDKHEYHLKNNIYNILNDVCKYKKASRSYSYMKQVACLQLLGLATIHFTIGAKIDVRPTKLGWKYANQIIKNPRCRSKTYLIRYIINSDTYLYYRKSSKYVQASINDLMYTNPLPLEVQVKALRQIMPSILTKKEQHKHI